MCMSSRQTHIAKAMAIRFLMRWCVNALFILFLWVAWPVSAANVVNQWSVIQSAFFADKTVHQQSEYIQIEAPIQAEDASVVPVSVQVTLATSSISKVYFFTDANPILLTATFAPMSAKQQFKLATRIRLESNSHFRVVVEDNTGRVWMNDVIIKTPGGGCGGGLSSDEAILRATAGEMKILPHWDPPALLSALSFYIRHPMRTGFERTTQGYYAKAWYMQHLAFHLDASPLLQVTLGPGMSANPYLRLYLDTPTPQTLSIEAKDNEGQVFNQQFSLIQPN